MKVAFRHSLLLTFEVAKGNVVRFRIYFQYFRPALPYLYNTFTQHFLPSFPAFRYFLYTIICTTKNKLLLDTILFVKNLEGNIQIRENCESFPFIVYGIAFPIIFHSTARNSMFKLLKECKKYSINTYT